MLLREVLEGCLRLQAVASRLGIPSLVCEFPCIETVSWALCPLPALVWEWVRSAVQFSNVLQLWGTLTHTPVLLHARFPGQGAPAFSFGPDWSHKPSASWGKRVRVCSAARQDVANPELYFFSCNSLSFVLTNTTTWGRLLVQSANNALLCSLLLGVLCVTLQIEMT